MYSPSAVYAITPSTEAAVLALVKRRQVDPVSLSLPEPPPTRCFDCHRKFGEDERPRQRYEPSQESRYVSLCAPCYWEWARESDSDNGGSYFTDEAEDDDGD